MSLRRQWLDLKVRFRRQVAIGLAFSFFTAMLALEAGSQPGIVDRAFAAFFIVLTLGALGLSGFAFHMMLKCTDEAENAERAP